MIIIIIIFIIIVYFVYYFYYFHYYHYYFYYYCLLELADSYSNSNFLIFEYKLEFVYNFFFETGRDHSHYNPGVLGQTTLSRHCAEMKLKAISYTRAGPDWVG